MIHGLFSQENLRFSNLKEDEKFKEVKFSLSGIKDEYHKKELYNILTTDNNIHKFIIDNDDNCMLLILKEFDADYIYNIITPMGISFKEGVSEQTKKTDIIYPPHYPQRTKADGKDVDDSSYQKALEFWKQKYPEEWEEFQKNNK